MKGKRPDYSASTVIHTENGDRWRDIGVGFVSEGGTITVLLDALPLSGKLILRTPQRRTASATST